MRNYLLILLSFFTFFISQAQLSNKHWLSPIHARQQSIVQDHHLYISTAETTPFLVTVTYGNGQQVPGSPYLISKNSPRTIQIDDQQPSRMFVSTNDLNVVRSDKGLILEGPKDFYVSFRMRSDNHAETIISKGKPGIGTEFRLGSLPNGEDGGARNFVSSVMATENNTTINLSDYDTGVVFTTNNNPITADTQTFTLNAGQSIVFSGYTDVTANLAGFIGALLTSDKPVAVITGNALAGLATFQEGQDFTLDQIVGADKIGSEYIFIRGNGNSGNELPLLIAHQDNTQIFLNGNPIPVTTLNSGDYYLVPSSNYQGVNNQNMYVVSSKPIYAYQILAGNSTYATSGLNFIPPLSCFFQNSVYLPAINKIGNTFYGSELMILTYATSTITINGNPVSAVSEPVLGNTEWVTYRISGYGGDVEIISTGPLAVGVFGYSEEDLNGNPGTVGYAGYYSGFGSEPEDTTVVVCSSTTKDLFEAIEGNPGTGGTWTVPPGGPALVNNIFDPNINIIGEYIYEFTKDCNSSPTTIPVKVNVTIEQANNAGTNAIKNTCKNAVSFDMFSLLGTGVTTGGTWSFGGLNRSNIFNPAVDVSGTYTYTIPASGACPALSATVVVNNYDFPTVAPITDLEVCDNALDGNDTNGETTFNLSTKTTEALNNQTNVTVTYHLLQNDAISGANPITTYSGPNRIIYVRLLNTITNCFNTTSFNVIVNPLPIVDNDIDLKNCDNDENTLDAISDFNLTEANTIISSQSNLSFKYYLSQSNAQNNVGQIINDTNYNSADGGVVWARIENENGCIRTAKVNLVVSVSQIPPTFPKIILESCDIYIDNPDPIADEQANDGYAFFDFTTATDDILALFPVGQNLNVSFYKNQNDALTESDEIITTNNPDDFRNTVADLQQIWVRVDSNVNNDCVGLGQYVDLVVNPLPDFDIIDTKILCVQPGTGTGSFAINATPTTPGTYTYTWTPTNPETTGGEENAVFNASETGVYKVLVTNTATTCFKEDETEVIVSSEPQAVEVQLISDVFTSGLSTIQAIVIGGFGTYEYSLDQIEWQNSPTFTNLENNIYTIYVRDINGCGMENSNPIATISYPNYFTPNGDSYHDTWNISGLTDEFDAKIYIFDRYGKLLKQINAYGNGWDGKFNGQEMPSTDYWFKIEYLENGVQKEFKSHFSLKR